MRFFVPVIALAALWQTVRDSGRLMEVHAGRAEHITAQLNPAIRTLLAGSFRAGNAVSICQISDFDDFAVNHLRYISHKPWKRNKKFRFRSTTPCETTPSVLSSERLIKDCA
jgi:hypothetical protein